MILHFAQAATACGYEPHGDAARDEDEDPEQEVVGAQARLVGLARHVQPELRQQGIVIGHSEAGLVDGPDPTGAGAGPGGGAIREHEGREELRVKVWVVEIRVVVPSVAMAQRRPTRRGRGAREGEEGAAGGVVHVAVVGPLVVGVGVAVCCCFRRAGGGVLGILVGVDVGIDVGGGGGGGGGGMVVGLGLEQQGRGAAEGAEVGQAARGQRPACASDRGADGALARGSVEDERRLDGEMVRQAASQVWVARKHADARRLHDPAADGGLA